MTRPSPYLTLNHLCSIFNHRLFPASRCLLPVLLISTSSPKQHKREPFIARGRYSVSPSLASSSPHPSFCHVFTLERSMVRLFPSLSLQPPLTVKAQSRSLIHCVVHSLSFTRFLPLVFSFKDSTSAFVVM